ncbi:MAG: hypothetical protein QOH08_1739 [Chloroflexota bacterium]|nr:hypothetical protein [Chloroflexota bacterium]
MRRFGPAPVTLEQRLVLDAALDEAFAPLRTRGTAAGPARARAAARWSDAEPSGPSTLDLLARISKVAAAAVISAFLFAGSVASIQAPGVPDISRDAVTAGEWTLNGRNAYQRPILSRFADYRTTAGDIAVNAASARRPEAATPAHSVRDSEPFADTP